LIFLNKKIHGFDPLGELWHITNPLRFPKKISNRKDEEGAERREMTQNRVFPSSP
jgi:hypothetical protein